MPRQRASSPAAAPTFDQPLSELDITPLIDVMLVVLAMTILSTVMY